MAIPRSLMKVRESKNLMGVRDPLPSNRHKPQMYNILHEFSEIHFRNVVSF